MDNNHVTDNTEQPPELPPRECCTPKPPKSRNWLLITLVVSSAILLIGFISLSIVVTVIREIAKQANVNAAQTNYGYRKKVVENGGQNSNGQIAIINITGTIMGNGSHISGSQMVERVAKQLRNARNDSMIKGVILQINSGGGGLSASDIIYNEVKLFKAAEKPIVVYIGSMAASGGYYIAVAADYIVASPTSLVGSFGVIQQHVQVDELLQKIGVKVKMIKSTKMKDIGSPFRDMTAEEKAFFQQMISTYHEKFIDIICEGRTLKDEDVRPLANGKIYTAKIAHDNSLIDEIGYFDEALAQIKTITGLNSPSLVVYSQAFSLDSLLQAKSSTSVEVLKEFQNAISNQQNQECLRAEWSGFSADK
jgi:protease-4